MKEYELDQKALGKNGKQFYILLYVNKYVLDVSFD